MIGTGYVGLVSGVCFADLGNTVYCVDKDVKKINLLNSGEIPIYEPGLAEIVRKNFNQNRLFFTTKIDEAIKMLQYPRIIGTHNNIDILLDKGRYGLYIKYNDKNFSYKITDEENININELVDFIEFSSTSNNGLIKIVKRKNTNFYTS